MLEEEMLWNLKVILESGANSKKLWREENSSASNLKVIGHLFSFDLELDDVKLKAIMVVNFEQLKVTFHDFWCKKWPISRNIAAGAFGHDR